jgi:hypothetical protein
MKYREKYRTVGPTVGLTAKKKIFPIGGTVRGTVP